MARPTNFLIAVRELVRREVSEAMRRVLGAGSGPGRRKTASVRRRRRRPGRPRVSARQPRVS